RGSRFPTLRAPGAAARGSQACGSADAVPAPGEALARGGTARTRDRAVWAVAGADAAACGFSARAVAVVVAVAPGAACGARRGDAPAARIARRPQGALVAGRGSGRSLLTVDAAGVAAAARIVHMQERGPRIGEEAFDQAFQALAFIDFGIEHPALGVVRTHRQLAASLLFGHHVVEYTLRPCRFAHEDRSSRAIRAVRVQVVPVQQDQRF